MNEVVIHKYSTESLRQDVHAGINQICSLQSLNPNNLIHSE